MYSVVLTEKINQLELVRSWASQCGYGNVRDSVQRAISTLMEIRNDVIRNEEAAASRAEQARHSCKCGKGGCGA